jgi:hypothetical protein
MSTKRIVKRIGMSLAITGLGFAASVNTALAGKLDELVGDWDLNIAKSTFQPRLPMKKYTMKVVDAGADHLLIKSDWIESDGTAGHVEYSTAFDGKAISIIDYPMADSVTDTVVHARTWISVWTKDGKIVEREVQTLSADGKILRDTDEGKDDKGKKFKNRLVFERP